MAHAQPILARSVNHLESTGRLTVTGEWEPVPVAWILKIILEIALNPLEFSYASSYCLLLNTSCEYNIFVE